MGFQWQYSKGGTRIILNSFLGFFLLLLTVGITSILGINKLTKELTSMYRSGIVPEHDVAILIKLQYENRYLLEEYITGLSHEKLPAIQKQLNRNNQTIEQITEGHISGSYFTEEKKLVLKLFMASHKAYKAKESAILDFGLKGNPNSAISLFEGNAYNDFSNCIKDLNQLEDLELSQGSLQLADTIEYAKRLKFIVFVSLMGAFILAVIIGMIIGRSVIED